MPSKPRDNPFESPISSSSGEQVADAGQLPGRPGFAHQAVRFSLYAPVLLAATNWILRESVGADHFGTKVFAAISTITIVAAFLLGMVGTVANLRRLDLWSALLGLIGTTLNAAIIYWLVRWLR